MIAPSDIQTALPKSCEVRTPSANDTVESYLSDRWMNLGPSTLPAATIVPSVEEDVAVVVGFAAENGLKVIPKCGGLGGLVLVNNKTLYLDMKNFTDINVDSERRTVTVGGGVLVKQVLKTVLASGFYTGWANFSSVGLVGNVLGGGLNLFMNTKGFSCDNIVGARIVTGMGDIKDISSESTGDEKQLLNLLRGAGSGLGVVISITLRLYPIADLGLAEGNVCPSAIAIFSRDKFKFAAELWESVTPISRGGIFAGFVFSVGPPGTPLAGQPVIVLSLRYPGSAAAAQKAFESYLTAEVRKHASMVREFTFPLENMNDQADASMTKTRNMDCFNSVIASVSGASLLAAANRWLEFSDKVGPIKCMSVFALWNKQALSDADSARQSGICHRDRQFMLQTTFWDVDEDKIAEAEKYALDVQRIVRSEDVEKGLPNRTLPGVARLMVDMNDVYTPEILEMLKKTKDRWDPKGVFWSPAVDGWSY